MLTIPNRATVDRFTPALQVEEDQAETLAYLIANASVIAQFRSARRESGGYGSYSEDVLLTPSGGLVPHCSGARFRSAVAGTPAQVVAILTTPDDPQIGAGIPFIGSLSASGEVTTSGITEVLAASNADLLGLGVAATDVPGASLAFTVVGQAATYAVFAVFDLQVTGAGVGAVIGEIAIDGAGLNALAICGDLAGLRGTFGTNVAGTIAAGNHTVKLTARKAVAGGVANLLGANGNTRLVLVLNDKS